MKFCKNLQRVADISDPEWAPYWTNYKMLKKLIKELPSLVPSDGNNRTVVVRADSMSSLDSTSVTSALAASRQPPSEQPPPPVAAKAPAATSSDQMGRSPGEVAFFKLLHAEFRKAAHFFDRAEQEFLIREERVREGMTIMKQPNSIMVSEKWSLLARSIYRLYKDLLLLETFAIMTYCSFSKILKKHDKVTGYNTRNAFMANVVNKANFTNYPKVMDMINRCEQLYEEVSDQLLREGKAGLLEDERLFINMIHRLNEQISDTADSEGAERKEPPAGRGKAVAASSAASSTNLQQESQSSKALRGLVEEIEKKNLAAQVSEGQIGVEEGDEDDSEAAPEPAAKIAGKRPASAPQSNAKRSRES